MKKRLLCALLAALTALLLLAPAGLAEEEDWDGTEGYYYVYTENGKTLNVRDAPGGTVVGHLKYGSRVFCYYRDGGTGWALIDFDYDKPGYGYGTYACFVSNRFLVKNKPAARKPAASGNSGAAAVPAAAPAAGSTDFLTEINAEFASAVRVDPYKVTVRPTRASGWVNMRWAPSKSAQLMATYGANAQLLVIRETKNWVQVEDQDTGDVGFMDKAFVVK